MIPRFEGTPVRGQIAKDHDMTKSQRVMKLADVVVREKSEEGFAHNHRCIGGLYGEDHYKIRDEKGMVKMFHFYTCQYPTALRLRRHIIYIPIWYAEFTYDLVEVYCPLCEAIKKEKRPYSNRNTHYVVRLGYHPSQNEVDTFVAEKRKQGPPKSSHETEIPF